MLTKPTIHNPPPWNLPPIPEDFTLIQDTREQLPLFTPERQAKSSTFLYRDKLLITTGTLRNGDYSVIGYEDKVCIELKRMGDFLSYLGAEREKTEEKLTRMQSYYFKALLIHCEEPVIMHPDIYSFDQKSRIKNTHVRGFLKSCRIQYGVHVYISPDIEKCREFVVDHLTYAVKKLREQ